MNSASSIYWVLVADSGTARFIELQRSPPQIREAHTFTSTALHKRSGDLTSDASGRSFHVQGPTSHSKQQRSDAHDLAEAEFSRFLANKLEQIEKLNSFERLLIVTDPRTLGRLRPLLSKPVAARVADEWDINLTGLSLPELENRLRARLGWPG